MKIKTKYRRMAEIYRLFSQEWELDFGENSLKEMHEYESKGIPMSSGNNGYFYGKQWMDVQITMWKEDIKSDIISLEEIYADPKFPHWWLDKVLNNGVPFLGHVNENKNENNFDSRRTGSR